ncbi:hypothetical protein ENBRE01_2102 [Enteropsectra breve]|nr:hypothetical protein ENBRE01_2102 [Enteropsectra breve]
MEFIKSQRNKPMVLHDGFAYNLDSRGGDTNHWRCRNRRCKEYLLVRNTEILDSTVHNYAPNEAVNRKLICKQNLKHQAAESSVPALIIITRATSSLNTEVLHNVPSYDNLNDIIRQ